MSTDTATSRSPYPRDNWWGEADADESRTTGHTECSGTDPASYLAYRELLALTTPVCKRSLSELDETVELTDPEFYLPKQVERSNRYVEYRQHRHRRRVNPDTGWINWGETTATAVPEVDEDTYLLSVHNYLWRNHVRQKHVTDWLRYAKRLFQDQQLSSKEALAVFIRKKRAFDDPRNLRVTEVPK